MLLCATTSNVVYSRLHSMLRILLLMKWWHEHSDIVSVRLHSMVRRILLLHKGLLLLLYKWLLLLQLLLCATTSDIVYNRLHRVSILLLMRLLHTTVMWRNCLKRFRSSRC